VPERVVKTLEKAKATRSVIVFEYFFSAHAINEEAALDSMKKSVAYWRKALPDAGR
jgi:hypothetical protein